MSHLFWSCQYLALNMFIPIGEGLEWKWRKVYQNHQGCVSKTHLKAPPLEGRPVRKEEQHNPLPPLIKSKGGVPPARKTLPDFVLLTAWKVQMQECFPFASPNLNCWDISSRASSVHNDILVLLIQPHPYTLKILILPWCLHISNICSPLKRYRAHGEIEVHIWKT